MVAACSHILNVRSTCWPQVNFLGKSPLTYDLRTSRVSHARATFVASASYSISLEFWSKFGLQHTVQHVDCMSNMWSPSPSVIESWCLLGRGHKFPQYTTPKNILFANDRASSNDDPRAPSLDRLYLCAFSHPSIAPDGVTYLTEQISTLLEAVKEHQVTPGSPADRAGFHPSDVLVEFDGKPVGTIKEVIFKALSENTAVDGVDNSTRRHPVKDITQGLRPCSTCSNDHRSLNRRDLQQRGHVGDDRAIVGSERGKEAHRLHVTFFNEVIEMGSQEKAGFNNINGLDTTSLVIFNDLGGEEIQAEQGVNCFDISEDFSSAEASRKNMQGPKKMIAMDSIDCVATEKHNDTTMDVVKRKDTSSKSGREEDDPSVRDQSLVPLECEWGNRGVRATGCPTTTILDIEKGEGDYIMGAAELGKILGANFQGMKRRH
ncbi:hypothetical protein HAX54_002764 [Datura stramonium]|uniref:PDZ domain-containing protein n=1 Tax=Datura stramonium TaxID=4076 RepID=A0ABS8T5H7_DATST|nr:hypothetical protein [Datura stramonium]